MMLPEPGFEVGRKLYTEAARAKIEADAKQMKMDAIHEMTCEESITDFCDEPGQKLP